ncbi:Lactoylglutathione lyase/glyoxalase I family protein [Forsythia ovata]|uniref:Lactoylglutathione lyase/glyoxalase I family protein n=1 Tax=Forsythia ovata TaxID=205694 RepID=A0ABD1PIU2_9LAMI
MAAAKGACLNHVSRESTDIKRLAQFYIDVFGFEQVESPKLEFEVIWLKLGSSLYLHLIERDPNTKLPEGPWSAMSAVADPKNLPRGHHICLSVSNFNSFVQTLKEKGVEVHEKTQPDGKTKQAFFFDPDGNGLEVSSQSPIQ